MKKDVKESLPVVSLPSHSLNIGERYIRSESRGAWTKNSYIHASFFRLSRWSMCTRDLGRAPRGGEANPIKSSVN